MAALYSEKHVRQTPPGDVGGEVVNKNKIFAIVLVARNVLTITFALQMHFLINFFLAKQKGENLRRRKLFTIISTSQDCVKGGKWRKGNKIFARSKIFVQKYGKKSFQDYQD